MKKNDVIYIVDVLAINNEFFGCKPPKERYSHHFSLSLSLSFFICCTGYSTQRSWPRSSTNHADASLS